MASYYRTIKGKKYDRALLDLADSLTSGRGDGRISLQDARAVLKKVKDGGEYSDTEKRTMQYIRDNYKFTEAADKWFRDEIRKWAANKKKNVKKAPAKKAAKKVAPKKKAAKKKSASKKTAGKKKAAKKAPAKKKSAPKKATKKKSAPKPQPVPAEPYVSTVPEPSPILQQEQKAEKEGMPWIKLILALIIIAVTVYLIHSLWNCSPAEDTGTSPVKIEKKAESPEKDTTPAPVEIKEEPVKKPIEVSIERQAPVVESIESLKVYFAKGSGWINHAQRKKLLKIADYLKKHSDRKIFIIGHACSLGNAKLNNDLSLYRARNAKKYLKLKGVDEEQILLVGIGAKHPVKEGSAPENLWENRLIEFDVR